MRKAYDNLRYPNEKWDSVEEYEKETREARRKFDEEEEEEERKENIRNLQSQEQALACNEDQNQPE